MDNYSLWLWVHFPFYTAVIPKENIVKLPFAILGYVLLDRVVPGESLKL